MLAEGEEIFIAPTSFICDDYYLTVSIFVDTVFTFTLFNYYCTPVWENV